MKSHMHNNNERDFCILKSFTWKIYVETIDYERIINHSIIPNKDIHIHTYLQSWLDGD